jgi:hypothetical protein
MQKKSSSTSFRNCDTLINPETAVIPAVSKHKQHDMSLRSEDALSRASSKCVKESGLSTSESQILASEFKNVTSLKTVCNSAQSDKNFQEPILPGEPFLCGRSKQMICKKHNCYMLDHSFLMSCLKAAALLSGKWFILHRRTLHI